MPGVYFCGAAALSAIFALGWLLFPRRRPGALLSAAALAPFGFLGYVFVPGYWEPDHLVQFVRGVGIEDFLICFSEGGLAWLLAGYGLRQTERQPLRRKAGTERRPARLAFARPLLRFALFTGAGGGLSLLGALLGLEVMTAIVVGFTLVGAAVGAGRSELLPGALVAGPSFAALHVGVGAVVLAIWPEAAEFWSVRILAGVRTFGLPVEEFAWALTFGACWPLFVQVAFFDVSRERGRTGRSPKQRLTGSTRSDPPLATR
jgi:hypothetical protein